MGRKTKNIEDKKIKISASIDEENFKKLNIKKINKSKLINSLLEEFFKK